MGIPGSIRPTPATWAPEKHSEKDTRGRTLALCIHTHSLLSPSPSFPARSRPCPARRAPVPVNLLRRVFAPLHLCAPAHHNPWYLGHWSSPQPSRRKFLQTHYSRPRPGRPLTMALASCASLPGPPLSHPRLPADSWAPPHCHSPPLPTSPHLSCGHFPSEL